MTCNLLEALPLPLLLISGSCPWKNYLKTLSSQARHIKVPIRPGVYGSFVLDFRSTGIRRISCHIPHPESLFYNKTLEWESDSLDLALRTDCSINLVLELMGLSSLDTGSHFLDIVRKNPRYRPKALTTTSSPIIPPMSSTRKKAQQPRPVCNGLTKCYAYIREEQNLGKHLTLNQYDQNFIDWALQIYGVIAEDVLEKGESLAVTIKWIIADKVHAANEARRQVERIVKAETTVKSEDKIIVKSKDKTIVESEDPPPPNNSGYQEHRSGKRAHVMLHEAFNDISTVAAMPAAKRLRPRPKDTRKRRNITEHELLVKSENEKNPPSLNNSEHERRNRANVILYGAVNNISAVATMPAVKTLQTRLKVMKVLHNKIKHELPVKSEDEKEPPLSSNSAYQEHGRSNRAIIMSHRAINDISTVAAMPAVKRLRPGPKDMRKPRNRIEHELWHSKIVKVWASGDIYFWIPSEEMRLGIRMGAKLGRKLKARVVDSMDDPRDYTIEFVPDGIRIKYGNDVIWHRSAAGLASLGDGKRLLEQLDRELKAQGFAEETSCGSPKD
jgi:hypothetical protein